MEIRTGRVTGRTTGVNRDSSDVVRLLQTVVTSKRDVRTVQLSSQTGEESSPPDGSLVVLVSAGEALKFAVSTNDFIAPTLEPGGKRIYSTDSTGTKVKAEIRLDPDGKITVTNPGSSITITPEGNITVLADGETVITSEKTTINNDVQINGALDVSESVTAPYVNGTTEVNFAGIDATTHVHGGVDSGTENTGVPV